MYHAAKATRFVVSKVIRVKFAFPQRLRGLQPGAGPEGKGSATQRGCNVNISLGEISRAGPTR